MALKRIPKLIPRYVQVTIFRLRQQEEFVHDLCRLIDNGEPECPALECPQAIDNHKTQHSPNTQGDPVMLAGKSKEEQTNARECTQKFEACQGGNTGWASAAKWFHTFSLFT